MDQNCDEAGAGGKKTTMQKKPGQGTVEGQKHMRRRR